MYDAYIYDLWSLILIHVCMMCTLVCTMYTCVYDVHIWCAYGVYGTHIYDPGLWSWYMHVWCTYLRSLILLHVCIMQVCMMNFDPQSLALMHVWCIMYISMILMQACIYDAANFVPDGRANEQGDSRSWIEIGGGLIWSCSLPGIFRCSFIYKS